MPRKTKEQREQEQAAKAAEQAAAALAARPFAFESTAPFASLAEQEQAAVAASIASDKRAGLSGNELRAKYGERLSGPARRKVLRAFGEDSGTIARSYSQYRDGESRSGTRHAKEHGALAAAARAEQAKAEAEAAVGALSAKACRSLLRESGAAVPTVRGGDESALRAATVAAVLAGAALPA